MNEFAWKLLEFQVQDACDAAVREGARMAYDAKLRLSILADLADTALYARRGNRWAAYIVSQNAAMKMKLLSDPTMWAGAGATL